MTVTELRAVTKQKFQVEIDGQPAFVLYKGELSRCHIEKGRGISPETYREITEEILPKRAKMRAMHLLEQGDWTRRGLEDKLLKSGYPPHAAEEALAYVESFHYIDDKRYATKKERPESRWNFAGRECLRRTSTRPFQRQRRTQIPEKLSGSLSGRKRGEKGP